MSQSAGYIIFSEQLNYIIVAFLFQVKLEERRDSLYIFRAYITTKDGKRIYAKTYGKRAFRIWVGPGPEPDNKHN